MSLPTDASSSLSDDIQRALQQAVGDANNVANLARKKKSKRVRESDIAQSDGSAKKKRSLKSQRDAELPLAEGTSVQIPEPVTELHVANQSPPSEQGTKKKKKKSKGREPEQEATQPTTSMNGDNPTSSADFISAVVAAASATSNQPSLSEHSHFDQSIAPFLDYSQDFGSYPYPQSGHSVQYDHPQHPPAFFSYPPGLALPDLNLTSSEDLLRTLQEFDLPKVVNVLRTLGEAANAANISLSGSPAFMPPPPPPGPPPVNQQPIRSDAILGRPPKQKRTAQSTNRTVSNDPSSPVPLEHDNPEHAHILANVWMNAAKLAEMVKKEGLVYKKGKFSAIETAQLNAAIERYRVTKGLTHDQLSNIIFAKEKGRDSFWPEITSALHLRPIIAVYHHVRRTYHPLKQQGRWMPAEDEILLQAVNEVGQQWERISERVGRMSSDCRDRYRNHLQNRDIRHSGPWTKEEEEELTRIVTEMTIEQGKDVDNDIFWGVVSQRMGGRRGRQQCRIKWTDSLSTQIKNAGERPRWSQTDAYILVHKIDSLNVRDDTEIDWKQLPDEHWNIWSAHSLQRRWLTMKRGIKGHEEMSHAEIMEILRTKKAQSPPPPTSNRKKKSKVTSAEAIVDPDDTEGDIIQVQAGPSTDPHIL
ncbi:hypothetical protein AcV5_001259 [Taiwanofungus camphoratus]|nr:hypothetical protein AcV5_001259 [Antrodia cinnamomea]